MDGQNKTDGWMENRRIKSGGKVLMMRGGGRAAAEHEVERGKGRKMYGAGKKRNLFYLTTFDHDWECRGKLSLFLLIAMN